MLYSPTMDKRERQSLILAIVREQAVGSQADVVRELSRRGARANQATVSRDLRELGLARVPHGDGYRYEAARRVSWEQHFAEFTTRVDGNASLIVLKTLPGCAHIVAAELDDLELPEIVGTVAGDDTVLVVPRGGPARKKLQARLEGLLAG